jgi:hypothetical protein
VDNIYFELGEYCEFCNQSLELFIALLVLFQLRIKNNFYSVLCVTALKEFKVVSVPKHHVMKTYGGVEVNTPRFLNLGTSGQLHALAALPQESHSNVCSGPNMSV